MSEEIKKFWSVVSEVAKDNTEFLNKNAKCVVDEIWALLNDAKHYYIFFAKHENYIELIFEKSAMYFYVSRILAPASYSVFVNCWLANLVNCFRELRFMVESLAKSYLADLKYSNQRSFREKLESLEKETKEKNNEDVPKKEYDFIKEFDEELSLKSLKLWGSLSEEAHMKRYVERVEDFITKEQNIPTYALYIPMTCSEEDLRDLQDLCNFVCVFREILKATMERYKTLF